MQLQSTFGAFLVAFTMVHGAPMIAQAQQDPAIWGIEQDAGLNPADNLPVVDKHSSPYMDNLGALDMTRTVARDTKKSPKPKGKSNNLNKAKGAEAGKKTVAGLASILDDKLDKDAKDEEDTEPSSCNGGGKKDEDEEKDDKDNDDAEKSSDEEDKDKDEKEQDKRNLRARSVPARRAPPKSNKSGSPGKDSKPSSNQQDGGSSIGKDIFTTTTSNVISDGILYGVDQALSEEDQPVKRAPPKSNKGGSPGKDTKPPATQQQDGGSSLGKDIFTQTTSNVISDGILYGVDQALSEEEQPAKQKRFGDGGSAVGKDKTRLTDSRVISDEMLYGPAIPNVAASAPPVKRSRRTRGGRYRFNNPKSFPGSSPGQLKDVDIPLPTTELFGVDQVINPDEESAAPVPAPAPPVKRSPRGGRGGGGGSSRGKPNKSGPSNSNNKLKDLNQPPSFDDLPLPSSDIIYEAINAADQGAGPQQVETIAKRSPSPRGGKFRGAGKDIAVDVAADGISKGIWYGVDEATTSNEKRSVAPAPGAEGEGEEALTNLDNKMALPQTYQRPKCAGKPGMCLMGQQRPADDLDLLRNYAPLDNSDVKLAVEPEDLTVAGGDGGAAMEKRQKGKGKGKGPSRTPSSGGGSTSSSPSSGGGSTSNPASSSPTKTEPKTDPKPNTAPAQAPAQAPASGGGFTQGAKDAATDIGTGAATGIIVAGVEQAIAPAQPTETVVVEAPPAAAAPVAGEEAAEAPVKRAVMFAA